MVSLKISWWSCAASIFAITLYYVASSENQIEDSAHVPESQPSQTSHTRMLAILSEIKDAPIHRHLFFGNRTIEKEDNDLRLLPSDRHDLRFKLLFHLGRRHLWLGNTRKAIDSLHEAMSITESHVWQNSSDDHVRSTFQLGLAYLRLGENENCVHCNNGESCLLPIRNAGVHTKRDGSRQATRYFQKFLDQTPDHVPAKWLLNIAYMTLGEHPLGVPARFRIDPQQFESKTAFPHFQNVAGDRG
jgi:tetratricopeptide (TPR) repeat protein